MARINFVWAKIISLISDIINICVNVNQTPLKDRPMFTIALCDDNQSFLDQEYSIASDYLSSINIEHKIVTFKSGVDLIQVNDIDSYDLILLDYEMEGLNGFETARIIKIKNNNACIAFVTVFFELAREGYKFDAIRYLIKQETSFNNELIDCINKAIQIKAIHERNIRTIEFIEETVTFDTDNIYYVQADKHYLKFYIIINNSVKCYKKRDKLSNIVKELEQTKSFAIIRTGLLINMRYIRSFDKNGVIRLVANDNKSNIFMLSDSNRDRFITTYMQYLGK